ncbi:DUF6731 family protein [Psychrobacillus sp. FSL K6-1464]|uniref:DUF6731 family protein n=1 Tax=Psychrobacillus sp. FSL K6-1464 TaxID=2921545 RepID=UPI0030FCF8A2
MARKYIRFNYFMVNLTPEGLPGNMAGRNIAAPWDMKPMLDYLAVGRNVLNGEVDVGVYIADFERETIINVMGSDFYTFQISKLRDTNIPAKKRVGSPKEDINLNHDEYIGEFVTIMFDPTYNTVGVQSNQYSLNIPQIEVYLTELRRRYKQQVGEQEQVPMKVELNPLIDYSKVDTIQDSEIFRKITVKGSSVEADALAQHGTLNEVSELLGRLQGLNFELTVSLGQVAKEETLDNEIIQEIVEGFKNIEDERERPNIEITSREDLESPIEIVNLLTPRLTNKISVVVENRATIGHQLIHTAYMESYLEQRRKIARVIREM